MRTTLRNNFIKKHHLEEYFLTSLKHDASLRRYFRLTLGKKTLILMDCPPEYESLIPFINVTKFLAKNNFSVPEIYHHDLTNGFLILEDFGDNIINDYLNNYPIHTEKIYFLIIDNLIQLAKISKLPDLPKHDKQTLISGITVFQTFYLESNEPEFLLLCNKLFNKLDYKYNHICLRDFHIDNLIYLTDRKSFNKIGLLDYQDASLGFLCYDLLSLLQDARRYISPSLQEKYLKYFLDNISDIDQHKFFEEYEILSFQRNARIIGLFNKFYKKNNNSSYLKYLDNVFKYFKTNLQSKHLKDIKLYLSNYQTTP